MLFRVLTVLLSLYALVGAVEPASTPAPEAAAPVVTLTTPVPAVFTTVTIAHTTFSLSYVAVVVRSGLVAMDQSLEEAAMDLGCPPLKTFLTITLPLIFPAIAAGWMLAFTLSFDDLVIASFSTGPGATTLPMRIYSEVRLGVKPEINAICTMVIALIAVVIVIASFASKLSSSQGESAAPL